MKNFLLLIVLIPQLVLSQAQNQPDGADAAMDNIIGGSPGVIHYPEPIAVSPGDEIVACIYADTLGPGPSGTYPVTDSLGNGPFVLSPVALTPGLNNPTNVYMMYVKATHGGLDIISTGPYTNYGSLQATRLKNVSGVVNASSAPSTVNTAASPTQISTTLTTTKNSALLVSCAGAGGFSDRKIIPTTNQYLVTQDQQGQATIAIDQTKAKGVKTQAMNIWGGAATFGMVTLAFEASPSIYLAETSLPEAAASSSYSYFLQGVGGINTLSYACTGLPSNGLSLNASTGEISGATPSAGLLSLGCTVSDGTSTSAIDNLTLRIGATFNTITFGTPVLGNFDSSTTIPVPSITCGDLVVMVVTGDDTHQRNGWMPATDGTNNYVRDSYGSPVIRVSPHGGGFSSPLVTYIIGPITTAGTDTITKVNNQAASSGNEAILFRVHGAQPFVDTNGSQNAGIFLFTGGGTVSSTLTTLVPNEQVFTTAMNVGFGGGFSTYTVGAPFSTFSQNGELLTGNTSVVAPGTVTGAVSFTSPNSIDGLATNMWALRPGLTPAACSPPQTRNHTWIM